MPRSLAHSLILFFGAFLVSWLYQTPPSLGDDLNYWGLAMDLHQHVPGAWNETSFHDLRWPVWGVCWLLQIPFGFSALSYYLEPMVYLGAGAIIVYFLAREVGASALVAFLAGILFLFHPQLDSVVDRPMPDLSEGFWVAAGFLAWLKLVRATDLRAMWLLSAAVGLCVAIGQANRLTGVFAVPVLVLATLAFYPRKFGWLVVCGAFAAVFVFVEMTIYWSITGDWLHSLHANLGARGRKGTEEIPLWELPFRFLPSLFRRHTDSIFNVLAVGGIAVAGFRFGKPGRALAAYAVIYFLTYSCALQSFSPPRPLVRDGDRFLASLGFPLAILTAFALAEIVARLPVTVRRLNPVAFLIRRPSVAFVLLAVILVFLSSRTFRTENYLREIAAHLRTVPEGTGVLSHAEMRHVAHLADPAAASRVNWTLRKDLLLASPDTLERMRASDQVWFIRKWIWTGTRKKSEYDVLDEIDELAPFLRPPLAGWTADAAIAKGDVPDFVFLSRRDNDDPLVEQGPDGKLLRDTLLPRFSVPHTWTFDKPLRDTAILPRLPIEPWLRGRTLFIASSQSSNTTEPVRGWVYFYEGERTLQKLTIKPYFFPNSSEDFHFIAIPPRADSMEVRLRVSDKARRITLDSFRIFLDGGTP